MLVIFDVVLILDLIFVFCVLFKCGNVLIVFVVFVLDCVNFL